MFQSFSYNPFINLSIEEYLLTCCNQGEKLLFFYRNDPCVVIGRFQNPWRECSPSFLMNKKIPLLRRTSGGGAVYHDNGNLNFCIITGRNGFSRTKSLNTIRQCLSCLGMRTECVDNNSITVNGNKISGSAFRYTKTRVLHHGTLLVSADLGALNRCLLPALKNGTCKGGMPSKRYMVTTINTIVPGITTGTMMNVLAQHITKDPRAPVEDVRDRVAWHSLQALVQKNKSFEWVFGKTPVCEARISLDNEHCRNKCIINIVNGRISQIMIPGFLELSERLTGQVKGHWFGSNMMLKKINAIQSAGTEKEILLCLYKKIKSIV